MVKRATPPPAPAKRRAAGKGKVQVWWCCDTAIVSAVRDIAEAEGVSKSEAANALLARALRRPPSDLRGQREIPGLRDSSVEYLLARRVKVEDAADAGGHIDGRVVRYVEGRYGKVAGERLLLRLVQGFSFDEIAARTGVSKQAVEQHLSRLMPKVAQDDGLMKLLARVVRANTRAEQEADDEQG